MRQLTPVLLFSVFAVWALLGFVKYQHVRSTPQPKQVAAALALLTSAREDSLTAVIAALRDSLEDCMVFHPSELTIEAADPAKAPLPEPTKTPPAYNHRKTTTIDTDPVSGTYVSLATYEGLGRIKDSLKLRTLSLETTNRALTEAVRTLREAPAADYGPGNAVPDQVPEPPKHTRTPRLQQPLPSNEISHPRTPDRFGWYGGVDVIPDTELGIYPTVGLQSFVGYDRRTILAVEAGSSTNFTAIRFGFRIGRTFR